VQKLDFRLRIRCWKRVTQAGRELSVEYLVNQSVKVLFVDRDVVND
jgi:hypothetical protein